MNVFREILNWSAGRPVWQRDALRRLVLAGSLDDEDYSELTAQCKSAHGLSENQSAEPLNITHIPEDRVSAGTVNLLSITHHSGVNALADDQTISFGSGLTVVYGSNASGKSGYTRILKSACQARGAEDILGNVLSGTMPLTPSVSIQFTVGDDRKERGWTFNSDNSDFLGRVSVFDSHSAAVYLKERTDVAFRPFGLDLFDKLSNACEEVKKRLERERRTLESIEIPLPELPEGTLAQKLISNLSSLTKDETIIELARLTKEEKEKLAFLEKRLADMQSDNPEKTARILRLRAGRLESLVKHFEKIDRLLDGNTLKALFDAHQKTYLQQIEAERLRTATFSTDLVTGTGSDIWKEMWDASRRFSEEMAYGGESFPFTGDDARCVLCQQNLDSKAAVRLNQFKEFVVSKSEMEFKASEEKSRKLRENLEALEIVNDGTESIVAELQIETDELAADTKKSLEEAASRRAMVVNVLHERKTLPANLPVYLSQKDKVQALVKGLNQRADDLIKKTDKETKEKITMELLELKARETLGKYEKAIKGVVYRKAQIAAYELCLKDTRTTSITKKSTEVTKEVVTKQLKSSFKEELGAFHFKHVEVELQEAGGERGALYHKLILKRAPGIELPNVVSEGEARCLSIAAFFAELSTADDPSAILFDDPVSSLDHKWRESVASRLVEEAKARQVIIFTHDIVFLLTLRKYAGDREVELHDQHLRRGKLGAGICEEELPWVAMKVKKRIRFLKSSLQEAQKLYEQDKHIAYKREATSIYKNLRDAWERAIEEVLLNGIVERFRENIQTQHVRKLADITEPDCKQIEAGMTKCSKWLHDQSPAVNEDIPAPDELKTDIDALGQWVKEIHKRR